VKAKRDAAAQARRLASELSAPEDRARVLRYAAELEAMANALQRQIDGPPHAPRVTQDQVQVQQAHSTEDDSEDSKKS